MIYRLNMRKDLEGIIVGSYGFIALGTLVGAVVSLWLVIEMYQERMIP